MADRLRTYKAKRDFDATSEPAGAPGPEGEPAGDEAPRRRFVVQEHHATRLHWDLRLEHDGALASFAVPNGLPLEPGDNRLAVHTEDHPLEYLDVPRGDPARQLRRRDDDDLGPGARTRSSSGSRGRSRSTSTASASTPATRCSRSTRTPSPRTG